MAQHDYYMVMTLLLYGCYFALMFLFMLIYDFYSIKIFEKALAMLVLGVLSVPFTALLLFVHLSDVRMYF